MPRLCFATFASLILLSSCSSTPRAVTLNNLLDYLPGTPPGYISL